MEHAVKIILEYYSVCLCKIPFRVLLIFAFRLRLFLILFSTEQGSLHCVCPASRFIEVRANTGLRPAMDKTHDVYFPLWNKFCLYIHMVIRNSEMVFVCYMETRCSFASYCIWKPCCISFSQRSYFFLLVSFVHACRPISRHDDLRSRYSWISIWLFFKILSAMYIRFCLQ